MDNLLTICLEAHHDDLNHHRAYRITVGRDLLGDWTVCIRYGRTGQRGQEKRFGDTDATPMQRIVREHLRRRITALKRIGCAYQLTDLDVAHDFESDAWIPGDLVSQFRPASPMIL